MHPHAARGRQDFVALGLVLAVAVTVRLVFLSGDPPILLTTDSLTYALPAMHLAHGEGFDLSLRRTPGYPLFLALLWSVFGDGAHPIVYAQHLLGVLTAGATWLLGRVAFGRLAGLLGGLAVALSGPQILYEHYLMTEALFTLLSVVGILALVVALRRDSTGLFVACGVLFGLCAATRPVGQAFPLFVPLAALVARSGSGPPGAHPRAPGGLAAFVQGSTPLAVATRAGLLALGGFSLVLLPWLLRNQLVGGELSGSSALGKTLFGRITRHDDGFRFDLPPAGRPEADPRRAQARAVARQAAQEDTSRGSLVHERLMREFGYGEAQAYNVMRDVALEVLLAQPGYFVLGSLGHTVELFLGQEEPLRLHLARLANPRLRADWQQRPELASLLPDPVTPEMRGQMLRSAIEAVRIYEPSEQPLASMLGALFLVGGLATLLRPAWRAAFPLPLMATTVLLMSAFLDGPVPRFRYPVDPFIALTAAAGLLALASLVLSRVPTLRSLRRSVASPPRSVQPEGLELR
jgi:hypothetical protein